MNKCASQLRTCFFFFFVHPVCLISPPYTNVHTQFCKKKLPTSCLPLITTTHKSLQLYHLRPRPVCLPVPSPAVDGLEHHALLPIAPRIQVLPLLSHQVAQLGRFPRTVRLAEEHLAANAAERCVCAVQGVAAVGGALARGRAKLRFVPPPALVCPCHIMLQVLYSSAG